MTPQVSRIFQSPSKKKKKEKKVLGPLVYLAFESRQTKSTKMKYVIHNNRVNGQTVFRRNKTYDFWKSFSFPTEKVRRESN